MKNMVDAVTYMLSVIPKMNKEDGEEFGEICKEENITEALCFAEDKGYINHDMFVVLKYASWKFELGENYYEEDDKMVASICEAFGVEL